MMTRILLIVILCLALFLAWRLDRKTLTNRARVMRWRVILRLRPGAGFASLPEIIIRWSKAAAWFNGQRSRPSLAWWSRLGAVIFPKYPVRVTDFAVRLGRAQLGRPVYARQEDTGVVMSPPRVGKSGWLASLILNHPGPVLCTSTRADLFSLTGGRRHRMGPVEVFNPQNVGDLPGTFRWNPLTGCENPAIAVQRAEDFIGELDSAGDMGWWQGKAAAALAAFLHAGALTPGATMLDVFAWVNKLGDKMAEDVLTQRESGSRALLAALTEVRQQAKYADSIRMTMAKSLAWISVPSIMEAVSPEDGAGFSVEDFIASGGTIYMIAPGGETSITAPLFRAFCSHVHYEAGMLGARSRAGKLDPPLLLALDEVTQICPVPLPSWFSDSAGKGILIYAVCHGMGQLESRWGKDGASTIWSTAGTKIFLPGITDTETLEEISLLCGSTSVKAGDSTEIIRVCPPEFIRRMPNWRLMVIRTNLSPVVVRFRPAWKRRISRIPAPHLTPAAVRRVISTATESLPPISGPEDMDRAKDLITQAARPPQWHRNGNGEGPGA